MSNQLINSKIPTTWLFGEKRGKTWNPVRGCKNEGCHLHPHNDSGCWAAKECKIHAKPWARANANWLTRNNKPPLITQYENNKGEIELIYSGQVELEHFIPYWFESQFQKQLPKRRSCIFVFSQTDLAFIPQEWVQKVIDKTKSNNEEREKAGLPLHVFQFLTKNPAVYSDFEWPLNCWRGFTAMYQLEFDIRYRQMFPPLKRTVFQQLAGSKVENPNCLRYAYLEPMQEGIDIKDGHRLDWVIVGGGPEPLNPEWVRGIRDQCVEAGIPFHFKGFGKYEQDFAWDDSEWENVLHRPKLSKKWPGRRRKITTLDGKIWEQFPEVE